MQRETILSTERLVVTTWLPQDVEELLQLHSDPVTMRYIGGRVESRAESTARLGKYLDEQTSRGWTKWRVATARGVMIGRGGFGVYGRYRELGYTLRRDVWGQGLATELAQALVQWHSANLYARYEAELVAYAHTQHRASRRVLEKIGFAFTDTRDHNGVDVAFYTFDPRT